MVFNKNSININKNYAREKSLKEYSNIHFHFELKSKYKANLNGKKFIRCKFENLIFENQYCEGVFFQCCQFINCDFINCNTKAYGFFKFSYCNLNNVVISECNIINLYIAETELIKVTFKNTYMAGCNLIGNRYDSVVFYENCNMMNGVINNNYKLMDITFINERTYTKLNYGTYIGRFDYKKFKKYCKREKEDNSEIDLNISNTYMEFGKEFLINNITGKYGICFYESKRAFHRTLRGKRRFISNIYNMVCGYGEKPSRTFVLSLALILLFGLIYMITGLKTFDNNIISINHIKGSLDGGYVTKLIIYSLYFSAVTFATVGYGDVMVVNYYGMVISIIEIIVGVFMVGVWISTLIRKMTR